MKACIGLFVFPLYRGVMCLLYSKMVSFTLNHIHFRREHYCATILFVQKKKDFCFGHLCRNTVFTQTSAEKNLIILSMSVSYSTKGNDIPLAKTTEQA